MAGEATQLIDSLGLDRTLVMEFFALFSRFEFALKRTGCIVAGTEKATAGWDTYANGLRGQFDQVKDETFRNAITFLTGHPPRTQIVDGADLGWRDTPQVIGEHHEAYVLRLVRIVRNNLFHGGKFPIPYGPVEDTARNEALIKASMTVLGHCLQLSKKVRGAFEETA